MYKVSELLSKKVISLTEAVELGTASDILFDAGLLSPRYLKVFNDSEEDKYLPFKRILSMSGEAVMVRSGGALAETAAGNLNPNPMNLEAFNQDGRKMGIISDISAEDGKILSFTVGKSDLPRETLLSYNGVMIFNDTGRPMKVARKKITALPLPQDRPRQKQTAAAAGPDFKKPPTFVSPERSANPCWFLLGKILDCDIYKNGLPILRRGTLVDENTIRRASESGKLIQLALHAVAFKE